MVEPVGIEPTTYGLQIRRQVDALGSDLVPAI